MEVRSSAPFGTMLRQLRLACGLSQEALAERARMSVDGIGALERGIRRAPQRQTVALLAAGLGLSPADRQRLESAAGRPRQLRRPSEASADDGPPERHNLPLTLTSFRGRERESATLRALLLEQRLVTLTGVGGVGKTRLALEIAHGLLDAFPGGVWLVEFAPLADPALVPARVAATLGVPPGFEAATDDAWIGEFTDKHLLVVFDNCEHLLAAAAALAQSLLERCPHVHVLATSREPLRIGGERVHRLDALELPRVRRGDLPSLEDLRGSPAIEMFFDRARFAAPGFKIDDADDAAWRALQTVCTRLDGMPFAIELAAARMNAMNLEMLAGALDRRFDLLTAGARTALPRHQTLRALLDWSYDLLTEGERRVLRRLAVFAGGWTLSAAEFVCTCDGIRGGEVLTLLASLVDKSLVVADTSSAPTRYGLLETTRAYALERLAECGEYDSASRAQAAYFLGLLERANANWGRPSVSAWLAPLEPELDNLRAAMQWALGDAREPALAASIAKAQHSVFELLSLFGEGVQWCERALSVLGTQPDPKLEAPLQLVLAKFYARGGYAVRGLSAATRAADLYRNVAAETMRPRDRAALASALALVGRNLAFMGRYAEADTFATQAVAAAREARDASTLAWTLYVKALAADAADVTARRALLAEALEYIRALPESFVFGVVLLGLGHADFDAGNFQSARAHARSALEHYRLNGLHEDLAIWAFSLSAVSALAAGEVDSAYADVKEALLHARRWLDISCAVQVAANVSALRGRSQVAANIVGASDALFAEMPMANIPITQILHDRTLAHLRRAASTEEVAAWLAEGRAWSFERVVAAARSL